jgi:hypothetical protein
VSDAALGVPDAPQPATLMIAASEPLPVLLGVLTSAKINLSRRPLHSNYVLLQKR